MRSVQVVEAEARFSALLEAVEGGETIAITRHGRIVARLVPDRLRMAADVFRPFWKDESEDAGFGAPADLPAEPVAPL